MIKFPIVVKRSDDARFAYLIDADGQVIAGAIHLEDAEQLVRAANAGASSPRTRSKKQRVEEQLRASDLGAQITGRTDIEYGHHETLPRGEHVARLGSKAR